jgi:hypothetical protein
MNNSKKDRLKVLFLASWYPNEDNPISGIFIKRHAQAVSKYCDVCVLYVHMSQHRVASSIECSVENGIKTVRVYLKEPPFTNRILKRSCGTSSYILSFIRGFRAVKKEFGKPDLIHVNIFFPWEFQRLLLTYLQELLMY